MTGAVRCEVFWSAACVLATAMLVAGCGNASLTAKHKLLVAGATAINDSGCEACHIIGADGNDGPGPGLTVIGAHLSVGEIKNALDNPRQPMPSFRNLPPPKFKSIVAYLASLHSRRDVITVAGSALNPKPMVLARTVVCKHRRAIWELANSGTNAEGSQASKKARAQLKRTLQVLCKLPTPKSR